MQKKKGISLIVLVITIIVMIILATTVIIALTNTGIVDRANQAVEITDKKQVEHVSTLVWAEAYADGFRGQALINEVTSKLSAYTSAYDIEVTETGVSILNKATLDANIACFEMEDTLFQIPNYTSSESYFKDKGYWPIIVRGGQYSVKKGTFYYKVSGQTDDKYVQTKVSYYYANGTIQKVDSIEQPSSGDFILFTELDKDTSYVLKVIYELEDGTRLYAVSDPTPEVCFVAGTKVYTENGLMNIEDVTKGMKVYSRNLKTGENELKTVLETSERIIRVATYKITVNGETIESTENHPYYVKEKGFIAAKKLVVGDVLVDANNNEYTINNIEIVDNLDAIIVYNMNVEGNHNYYVGENMILVHNVSCK